MGCGADPEKTEDVKSKIVEHTLKGKMNEGPKSINTESQVKQVNVNKLK